VNFAALKDLFPQPVQQGLNVIIQAAKVVAKHPDQEHVELLIHPKNGS